jgi:hypothetical protein
MVVQGQGNWQRSVSGCFPNVQPTQTRSLTATETGNAAVMIILSASQRLVAGLPATLLRPPNSSNDLEGFLTFCDNGMCPLEDSDNHDSLEYFDAEQFNDDDVPEDRNHAAKSKPIP